MNLQQLRSTLHQQIDQVDPNILHILHDITAAYVQGEKNKIEEIEKVVLASSVVSYPPIPKKKRKDKKINRAYSLEDLEKNMEPW